MPKYRVTLPIQGYIDVIVDDQMNSGMHMIIEVAEARMREAIGDEHGSVTVDRSQVTIVRENGG